MQLFLNILFTDAPAGVVPVLLLLARSSSVMVHAKTGDMLRFAASADRIPQWCEASNKTAILKLHKC